MIENKITLSVIIISYNTSQMSIECLQSIFEQTHGIKFEIIVLDNNSSDGSAKAIANNFPQVKLIAHKENLGFAAGNNLAIKKANGEYILLLNPDTLVLDGAIQKLHNFAQSNNDALIWGGRTLFSDKTLNPASCWHKMTLWSVFCRSFGLAWFFPKSPFFNTEAYGGWDRSSIRQVDIVSGCFFMIKHELWGKLDGFSDEFFMYGEEADLCLRAKKMYAANPMVTPDATIIHYGGASDKVRTEKMIRLMKAKNLLMKQHWPAWKYNIGLIIFKFDPIFRYSVLTLLNAFKPKYHEEIKVWQEIWSRRSEWCLF